MRITVAVAAIALLWGCSPASTWTALAPPTSQASETRAHALNLTPLNAPASVFPNVTATEPTGIRPEIISTTVDLQGGATTGGLYMRKQKTWVPIAYPNAASTAIYGPEWFRGFYRIVGSYKRAGQSGEHGFAYESLSKQFITLDAPATLCAPQACSSTIAHSTAGDVFYAVVGDCDAAGTSSAIGGHAFFYNSANGLFYNIDVRGAIGTTANGVWKDDSKVIVAGGFTDTAGWHAYVRDIQSSKVFRYDYPGATQTHFEGITGAGGLGNYNLAGDYTNPADNATYGFYIEMRNWTFGPPVAIGKLSANSVSEREVIGVDHPGSGISGFITTVPVTAAATMAAAYTGPVRFRNP